MSNNFLTDGQFAGCISFHSPQPKYILQFHGQDPNEIVGRIEIEDGELRFTGSADESAKMFFGQILKPMCDDYISNEMAQRTEIVTP
jgi:hypothetical protein